MSAGPRIIPVGGELPSMEPAEKSARRNGQSTGTADGQPKRSAGKRGGASRGRPGWSTAAKPLNWKRG